MASTVKTAISLQEDLFHQVNALAKELDMSRSKIFAVAMQEFIRRNETQKLLARINDAHDNGQDADEAERIRLHKQKQKDLAEEDSW